MTWRLLYVPQVGQAVCGSFGSRQFGQVISCGAVVFHCARRDLVLLRDIFRLGTATSVLLCLARRGVRPVRRHGRSRCRIRYFFLVRTAVWLVAIRLVRPKVLQRRPHRAALLMPVAGLGVGEPDPAFHAQALAVVLAQRRERQLQHEGVSQGRLEVQQTAGIKPIAIRAVRVIAWLRIASQLEQLLEPHLRRRGERLQAPRALASQRCAHGGRHQHALGHALKLDIQLKIDTSRDPDQLNRHVVRRRDYTCQGTR